MDISTSRSLHPETVIRAWKDADFAANLPASLRSRLPANPAGTIHTDTITLASGPSRTVGCNSMSNDCNTMSNDCNTMSNSCNTMSNSCNTMSNGCNTMSNGCNTMSNNCNTMSNDCNTMSNNCNTMGGQCTITDSCHRGSVA